MSAHEQPLTVLWGRHRVEALTDGIFAVAMTLLVIDLNRPDPHVFHTEDQPISALLEHLVDAGWLWRNLFQLAFVRLMPFSVDLIGEFGGATVSQVAYNLNMVMLGLAALGKLWCDRRHPAADRPRDGAGTYHGMLPRTGGLVACDIVAIVIAKVNGSPYSTLVYLPMMPIGRYSRHLETKARTASGIPVAAPASNHPEHP